MNSNANTERLKKLIHGKQYKWSLDIITIYNTIDKVYTSLQNSLLTNSCMNWQSGTQVIENTL